MPNRRARRSLAEAALLFSALGDETRLALLQQLSEGGPASISALAGRFPVTRQAITKHLEHLAAASMVVGHRHGREHVWTLNAGRLADARRALDLIGRDWDNALQRLKDHVEGSA